MSKMKSFIDIVDVPTKLHLQQFQDDEGLAQYRALRTELEDEYEIWEIIKQNPDELGFILQEQNYEMYLDTFDEEDRQNVPITEEQFNLVKNFFQKGE